MKKKGFILAIAFLLLISMTACQSQETPESDVITEPPASSAELTESSPPQTTQDETDGAESPNAPETTEDTTMYVIAGETIFTATLADNSSVQALVKLLREGPLTIEMSDYGNMEKVGPIGQTLPANDEPITTEPGDIILYQSNSLVIYYDTNSWNFTRIGKIDGVTQEELLDARGNGDVSVTFLLSDDESHS